MAHTLSITYGETPTTISLSATGTSAGYKLGDGEGSNGYQPSEAIRAVSYSSSLYTDGARPVFSRAGNIRETFDVEIQGTSIDDAIAKLRALKYAIRLARDYAEMPTARATVYLTFLPSGSGSGANYAYSLIYGGDVQEPNLLEVDLVSFVIRGVKVTIEREPFWRGDIPRRSTAIADNATRVIPAVTPGTFNAKPWGSLYIDGLTYTAIPGDIPALARIMFAPDTAAGLTVDKAIFAYRSEERYPPTGGATAVYDGSLIEAESGTNGTDCSNAADATASPGGGGNTKKTITFATKTSAKRISFSIDSGYVPAPGRLSGKYRAFARMKNASANTVTAFLKHYMDGATTPTATSTTAISFTATSWTMVDMGIVDASPNDRSLFSYSDTGYGSIVELWASATSTVDLYVDFLMLMPCDEYYLTITGAGATGITSIITASTIEPFGSSHPMTLSARTQDAPYSVEFAPGAIGTGALYLPPGKGHLFWISGSSSWVNTLPAANNHVLQLYRVARYLSARGAT